MVESIVGKGENAGYHYVFKRPFLSVANSRDCVMKSCYFLLLIINLSKKFSIRKEISKYHFNRKDLTLYHVKKILFD